MEKAVKGCLDSLLLKRKKCPWLKSRTIEEQLGEVESELEELRQAVENKDWENLKEEFGDILWDLFSIGVIAEEKGLFKISEALDDVHAKIKRRSPWVFGNETVSSKEEAVKRWYEIKAGEKAKKQA